MKQDTIAAIATALSPAGLGVIRISGGDAAEIADRVFSSKSGASLAETVGYRAMYGTVSDSDGVIDDAVALNFRAPHSYTGENAVELSCHGGVYILRRTLAALVSAGARLAEPGEFTMRAFENGKLDLTSAESVMDLIGAEGRLAHSAAVSGHDGALYRALGELRDRLVGLAADISAWVDFPDEDTPAVEPSALKAGLSSVRAGVCGLIDGFGAGKIIRDGIDTVIVGKPNVGKSTLMNRLAGSERSIVTPVAGTTRDIIEESVIFGGLRLRLSDTAGIRETDDAVERVGVGLAEDRLRSASLVLAVFDGSRPFDGDDMRLIELMRGKNSVAAVNKSDLSGGFAFPDASVPFVRISAATGEGMDALADAVRTAVNINKIDPNAAMLANERQLGCACRCRDAVDQAVAALDSGTTLDAVGVCIDDAVSALLELTGERVSDRVVDDVFSRFCVGK